MKTAFPLFLLLASAASTKGAAVCEKGISGAAVHAISSATLDCLATPTYSPPIDGGDAVCLAPANATTAPENYAPLDQEAVVHSAAPRAVFNQLEEVCGWLLDVATSATPLDGGAVVDAPSHCLYREVSAAVRDAGCADHPYRLPYDSGGSQHDAPFSVQLCPGDYNRRDSVAWLLHTAVWHTQPPIRHQRRRHPCRHTPPYRGTPLPHADRLAVVSGVLLLHLPLRVTPHPSRASSTRMRARQCCSQLLSLMTRKGLEIRRMRK